MLWRVPGGQMCRRTHMHRDSLFHICDRAPRLLFAMRRDAGSRGALFLLTLIARARKVSRPPGETRARNPQTKQKPNSAIKQSQRPQPAHISAPHRQHTRSRYSAAQSSTWRVGWRLCRAGLLLEFLDRD